MPESRTAVIGSGPGGSAFAALMAHAGHQVVLVEKNGFPGGKCSSTRHDGYVADTGVHMFGRGQWGPFGDITRILGEGPGWSARTPSFTLSLRGGRMEMGSSQFHPVSVASSIKGRLRGWQKMRWPSTAVKAAREQGFGGLLSLGRRFSDKRYPLYGELQDVSVRDFFSRLSDSDDFLQTFHAMAMLTMVLPWHRASMGEFAFILASTMRSSQLCYPYGGSGAIPASFLRALTAQGGELRLGCEAAAIETRGGRVRGITTAAGEFIAADRVVSSAGIKKTIAMAGREAFPAEYLAAADALRDSEAFIAVKYFLDRKISSMRTPCLLHMPDLSPHCMFDYLEDGSVPDDLFLFVTAPGIWDPSLVPPGKDCLIVGVPAPSDLQRVDQAASLLARAEEIAAFLFPEISGATVAVERVLTTQVSGLSGRTAGECIGIAQEVGQSGTNRPATSTPVQGLYLVGADAGGRGIGTEMAADSALRLYYHLR
ncbi:MAG: NAD(P)/FAD-dependent oxidoreductase [Actinomycetota bacterium]